MRARRPRKPLSFSALQILRLMLPASRWRRPHSPRQVSARAGLPAAAARRACRILVRPSRPPPPLQIRWRLLQNRQKRYVNVWRGLWQLDFAHQYCRLAL